MTKTLKTSLNFTKNHIESPFKFHSPNFIAVTTRNLFFILTTRKTEIIINLE